MALPAGRTVTEEAHRVQMLAGPADTTTCRPARSRQPCSPQGDRAGQFPGSLLRQPARAKLSTRPTHPWLHDERKSPAQSRAFSWVAEKLRISVYRRRSPPVHRCQQGGRQQVIGKTRQRPWRRIAVAWANRRDLRHSPRRMGDLVDVVPDGPLCHPGARTASSSGEVSGEAQPRWRWESRGTSHLGELGSSPRLGHGDTPGDAQHDRRRLSRGNIETSGRPRRPLRLRLIRLE